MILRMCIVTMVVALAVNTSFGQGLVNKSVLTVEDGVSLYVQTALTNSSGATINNDGNVIVSNNGLLTNQGTFYVFDDASLVQTTNGSGLSNSGTFNVQRQPTTSAGWTYWSSPVTSAPCPGSNPYSFIPNNSTQYYDDDNNPNPDPGWLSNSSNMTPGQGRASYNNSGLGTFIGTANNGNVSVPLSFTSYAPLTANPTPFNFVGNPYPCALDANQFVTDNASIYGSIYYWDHGGSIDPSDYAVWNGIGSVSPSSTGGSPDDYIGTGQGFFVRALNSGTLNFNNNMRVASNNTQFFRMDAGGLSRLWFSVENNANTDYNEILIGMLEDATDGEDRLYDAVKLRGNSDLALGAVNTDVNADWEYSIMGFPPPVFDKLIPLNVLIGANGSFTFTAKTMEGFDGYDVYFDDVTVPGYVYLQEGTEINVQLTEGFYQNRFYLGIVPEMIVTGDDDPLNSSYLGLNAFISQGRLNVSIEGQELANGILELIDLRGKVVWSKQKASLTRAGVSIPVETISKGLYSVRFSTSNKSLVQKVIKG